MAFIGNIDTSAATEIGCELLAGGSDIVSFDGATISFRDDADLRRVFDALTAEAE